MHNENHTVWRAVSQSFFFKSFGSSPLNLTESCDNLSSLNSESVLSDGLFRCLKHKTLHFWNEKNDSTKINSNEKVIIIETKNKQSKLAIQLHTPTN